MYNYNYIHDQEQLNGWFGRALKRLIVKVASFVDSSVNTATFGISSEIGSFANLAQDIGSGGSEFWQRGTLNAYDEILANLQRPLALSQRAWSKNLFPSQLRNLSIRVLSNLFPC